MAALIDKTYFFGILNIAQLSSTAVTDKVNWFINHYEPKFMEGLLGYELYKAFLAATAEARFVNLLNGEEYTNTSGQLKKWKGLLRTSNGSKFSPIANYVFYEYTNSSATVSTGSGEKKVESENSVEASPKNKLFTAWNEMVDMNCQLIREIGCGAETQSLSYVFDRKLSFQ